MTRADLEAIEALTELSEQEAGAGAVDYDALAVLAEREWSPLGAIESIRAMVAAVDVGRSDEAQPMLPLATISVTEDMATCMRLHAQGWKSAYHHEVLARGLAVRVELDLPVRVVQVQHRVERVVIQIRLFADDVLYIAVFSELAHSLSNPRLTTSTSS